jgi:hypothetical protein
MKKDKITQKQLAFYKLYTSYKEDPEKYHPTWEFGGEIFIKELNKWELMSYKAPTRLTDIFQENPKLLDRRMVKGKSGSKYYEYKIAPNPSLEKIRDVSLEQFYLRIKKPKLL